VVLRKKKEGKRAGVSGRSRPAQRSSDAANPRRRLEQLRRRLDAVTEHIQVAEIRIHDIDQRFCEPDYFARTPAGEVRALEAERKELQSTLAALLGEWETIEREVAALERSLEDAV